MDQFAKPFVEEFYTRIEPEFQHINTQINALQKKYMKAQMEVLPAERYYPDANSTPVYGADSVLGGVSVKIPMMDNVS